MRAILAAILITGLSAGFALAQEPTAYITGTPQWLHRPGHVHDRLPGTRTAMPNSALVVLDCLVASDGRLDCELLSEEPSGWGFGEAALRISRDFRMAPLTVEGEPTAKRRYRLRVPFETAE